MKRTGILFQTMAAISGFFTASQTSAKHELVDHQIELERLKLMDDPMRTRRMRVKLNMEEQVRMQRDFSAFSSVTGSPVFPLNSDCPSSRLAHRVPWIHPADKLAAAEAKRERKAAAKAARAMKGPR